MLYGPFSARLSRGGKTFYTDFLQLGWGRGGETCYTGRFQLGWKTSTFAPLQFVGGGGWGVEGAIVQPFHYLQPGRYITT